MWEFGHKVRTLVSGILSPRHAERRSSPGRSADWLPPVLGPGDYSIGITADRGANWYFDRTSA